MTLLRFQPTHWFSRLDLGTPHPHQDISPRGCCKLTPVLPPIWDGPLMWQQASTGANNLREDVTPPKRKATVFSYSVLFHSLIVLNDRLHYDTIIYHICIRLPGLHPSLSIRTPTTYTSFLKDILSLPLYCMCEKEVSKYNPYPME